MSDREPLFIAWHSEQSGRSAEICEEIDSVWLYLSDPGAKKVSVSSWLLNTLEAPAEPMQEPYRSQSVPPPAPAAFVESGGVLPVPDASRWNVLWGARGEAVAALLDGRPIGMVRVGQARGFARFIRAGAAPWALPWNEPAFAGVFYGHDSNG